MKKLVYVNPNKEDNCEVCKLNPNWKKVLSNYICLHVILSVTPMKYIINTS